MSNIWNKEAECMSAEERRQLQSARLVDAVRRVYDNVPFYRKKMQDLGLTPDDIHGIEDLSKLPFTTKADLRDSYPFEAFAVPREEIVRIHASSGTTGNPTIVGVTKNDITVWAECMARSLAMAGATRKDVVQVSYGYGLFTGGLGAHYGSEYLGALTIPTSGGNTSRQVKLMKDLGTDILCCTPSYALFLYDAMKEAGIDPHKDLKLRAGVFGAEPWTQEMREEIESKLGIEAFDVYGLSEIMGPGVSMSCNVEPGLHVQEDHFLPEIINPETCEVLPDGETGELVFTCITKEALPLIRYRTRDLSSLDHTPCACGRTTVRMGR
ncbi:MAG: phenylacetate--CoA ligase, partial [Clostridia bacterium]|nr:phenylacetate--CoA ligase [Clostridia bacterium]